MEPVDNNYNIDAPHIQVEFELDPRQSGANQKAHHKTLAGQVALERKVEQLEAHIK